MKTIFLFWLLLLVFAACTVQQPIYSRPAKNNRDFEVEFLFTHDGCRVYRFQDATRMVYFTNCNGDTAAYDTTDITTNRIRVKRQ
jgi:hypothetical protein